MSSARRAGEVDSVIFETALALDDPDLCVAFLEQAYRNDSVAFAQMTGLLRSARDAVGFFIEGQEDYAGLAQDLLEDLDDAGLPPGPGETDADETGALIGRYRLLSRIGEGGCGVVYEARQEEPVRRLVAVKIIRAGRDSSATVKRFASERQALGLMDHPHIARLFDGGATPDGRPYFVMELVRGKKITAYCDEHGLDLGARLTLFLQVCNAIQHAHQKGIVHRDIKPSNVLVTSQDNAPIPKVIDFGISIPIRTRLGSRLEQAPQDQMAGTPAYMSPEQVDMAGTDVDTRSDVYSLGVLLYELLVSGVPFDSPPLLQSGIAAMRQTILTRAPFSPSQALLNLPVEERTGVAASRKTSPGKLVAAVKGDLDWIVLKSLEKDRNNRHQTVNALATDIHSHLHHLPIAGRRISASGSLRRFIRRNRLAFASGLTIVLALFCGLGASSVLYFREKSALTAQARMSRIAETSRQAESKLRKQAQARENVARAALLLNAGEIDKADDLLRENPLESIEPSPEAAFVFTCLAEWNATNKHWGQAVECLRLLNQAELLNTPSTIIERSSLLETGPALLELGHPAEYERFRSSILEKYHLVRSPLGAEHLLKICLLTPANEGMMKALEPCAAVCSDRSGPGHFSLEWEAFSLALYYHRLHQPEKVLAAAKICLESGRPKKSCEVSMRYLKSMACARSGDMPQALAERNRADSDMAVREAKNTGESLPADSEWFDWSLASFLRKEAANIVQ